MNYAEALKAPFPAKDIEWRVQRSGITDKGNPWAFVLAYVTNRAIQNRLDEVFGIENWQNAFRDSGKVVECGIGVKFNGEWVWKWDAAEETQVEAVKGGRSAAMKRAAVHWGVGRYLYDLEANFAECSLEERKEWHKVSIKNKSGVFVNFWWNPPDLPAWALPQPVMPANDMLNPLSELKEFLSVNDINESRAISYASTRFKTSFHSLSELTQHQTALVLAGIKKRLAPAA